MNPPPAASVIIPTYNRAAMIGSAIESVLAQPFEDFELIVVDDGSTDGTREVVARFDDPRLHYIWQTNQERSVARNAGLAGSRAPYVCFLDADDRFYPNKLAVQVAALRAHPAAGQVLGGWAEMDAQGRVLVERRPWLRYPDPQPRDWFLAKINQLGAQLIRREWLERVGGFDPNFSAMEDIDLWLRLVEAGCRSAWVREIVMQRRRHAGNTIGDARRMRAAWFAILDKHFGDPPGGGPPGGGPPPGAALGLSKAEALARAYLGGAGRLYAAGEVQAARADLARAVEYDPALAAGGARRVYDLIRNWANDPAVDDPIAFTRLALANLPDALQHLAAGERQLMAEVWAAQAFNAYQLADWARVREAARQAVRYRPGWLLHRGLVAIWLRALRHT